MTIPLALIVGSKALSLAFAAVALVGCSQLMADRQRFLEGWRPGRILQVDVAAAIRVQPAKDCRKQATAESVSDAQYALVRYTRSPSHYSHVVAPVPPNSGLQVGDRVDVNVDRCADPMVKVSGSTQ